jgi:hypothetical protein
VNISLFKYLISLVDLVSDTCIFTDNIALLNVDRSSEAFLLIEIKFNSMLLCQLLNQKSTVVEYTKYVEGLCQRTFQQ